MVNLSDEELNDGKEQMRALLADPCQDVNQPTETGWKKERERRILGKFLQKQRNDH